MVRIFLVLLCLGSGPAVAGDCPAPTDTSEQIGALLEEVGRASNEMSARLLTNRMWEIWATAPDEAAQELLDHGMEARRSYNLTEALSAFDRLIAYCPDYAEGYNQRAFVNFMREDYAPALTDLDRAIALSPDHVAAAAGRALTLLGMGRIAEGQAALRAVLKRHPWLPERAHLIPEDQSPGAGTKL